MAYCFSENPFTAYRLLHLCTLVFRFQIPVTFFKVAQGSLYPGLGTVISYLRLSGKGTLSPTDVVGRKSENKAENAYIVSFILLKSAYQPINLTILEEFMERLLKVREARGRARLIWRFCLDSGLAVEEPIFLIGRRNRISRSVALFPTETGLAWSVNNDSIASERIDPEEAESIFSELRSIQAQPTKQEDLLLDLCPIIAKNEAAFSLYTMNFVPTRNVMIENVPGGCPFTDLRVSKETVRGLVERRTRSNTGSDQKSSLFLELLRARTRVGGKSYIFCSSQKDEQAGVRESTERIMERLDRETFEFNGKCPYRYKDICLVQSPCELLSPIKEHVPKDLSRLKFGR
jgi:hypothetical protein